MSTVGEVERFFDAVAPRYEEIVSGNGWPANDMLRAELETIPRVDQALDLGAGTGLSSEAILHAAHPGCVVAVDVSIEMLEQLRHRCNGHPRLVVARMAVDRFLTDTQSKIHSSEIRGRLRDRCNSDLRRKGTSRVIGQFLGRVPSRFDLVSAIGLFHFLPKPQEAIGEVAGILGSNGRFIFTYDPFMPGHPIHGERQTTYDLTVYRSTPEDIENGLRQSGLEVMSDRSFVAQPTGNIEYQGRFVVARKSSPSHHPAAQ